MNKSYETLTDCLKQIRTKTNFIPEIAIILGSGLGDSLEIDNIQCIINYSDIEGFPVSTNKMHKGRFIFGYISSKPVVVMQGRIHYYEGYTMEQVVMPVRLMKMMGASRLIVTNAAGGINSDFRPGDLMLITDHITSFVPSPLIGQNLDALGTRFPDMTHAYDQSIQDIVRNCAKDLSIDLKEGIYLQVTGPNYETPAEIQAYKTLGANAVGMSTACEVMTAVHAGMEVCGISCITNMAAGITGQPLDDKEVGEVASSISDKFAKLLKNILFMI